MRGASSGRRRRAGAGRARGAFCGNWPRGAGRRRPSRPSRPARLAGRPNNKQWPAAAPRKRPWQARPGRLTGVGSISICSWHHILRARLAALATAPSARAAAGRGFLRKIFVCFQGGGGGGGRWRLGSGRVWRPARTKLLAPARPKDARLLPAPNMGDAGLNERQTRQVARRARDANGRPLCVRFLIRK